jgi:hypothetical protein
LLCRTWIEKCDKNHPGCRAAVDDRSDFRLPTRLIDISAAPKLVLSKALGHLTDHECRYIALSYCWGPDPSKNPQTLQRTLQDHFNCLPPLPKTFTDAILVARRLDVRFLWIDSLCIIQRTEDFQTECALMHHIYSRAYCTLSALHASDPFGGLFNKEDRDLTSLSTSASGWKWKNELVGPLMSRGWAFQEHQVSARVIHFRRRKFLWECRNSFAVSDRFHGAPIHRLTQINEDYVQSAALTGHLESNRLFDIVSGLNAHLLWLKAIEQYSSRQLSHERDKLPAISGLAAGFSRLLESDTYLAGVWKGDLWGSLAWIPAASSSVSSRTAIRDIPTWSWASHNGPVQFDEPKIHTWREKPSLLGGNETLRRWEMHLAGADPFGEVSGGSLTLYVSTLAISIEERETTASPNFTSGSVWVLRHEYQVD